MGPTRGSIRYPCCRFASSGPRLTTALGLENADLIGRIRRVSARISPVLICVIIVIWGSLGAWTVQIYDARVQPIELSDLIIEVDVKTFELSAQVFEFLSRFFEDRKPVERSS